MAADATKDRRVTDLIQGPDHPALSDGSRLLWALPSPVHEELGFRACAPDRIQGDAVLPHPSLTAQSSLTAAAMTSLNVPTPKSRAVLTTVKAAARRLRRWPAASLDRRCARRTPGFALGTKKLSRSNQETDPQESIERSIRMT